MGVGGHGAGRGAVTWHLMMYGRCADEDLSPPRKRARASPEMGPSQEGPRAGPGLPGRMTDGTRTGMVSGREVAAEMALKRSQEAARVAAMDATTSGRNAETVGPARTTKFEKWSASTTGFMSPPNSLGLPSAVFRNEQE